jgi:hypothetical protein
MAADEPHPPGLLVPGNLDFNTRPQTRNPDGSHSSVVSMSFQDPQGREVLVPTIADDGRSLSADEAKQQYYMTGQHLGIFDSGDAATHYAIAHHAEMGQRRLGPRRP